MGFAMLKDCWNNPQIWGLLSPTWSRQDGTKSLPSSSHPLSPIHWPHPDQYLLRLVRFLLFPPVSCDWNHPFPRQPFRDLYIAGTIRDYLPDTSTFVPSMWTQDKALLFLSTSTLWKCNLNLVKKMISYLESRSYTVQGDLRRRGRMEGLVVGLVIGAAVSGWILTRGK